MSERNALPLIEKALEEKRVMVHLPGQPDKDLFLMKVFGKELDPLRDLRLMYGDSAQIRVEQAITRLQYWSPEGLRNHGVFIEPGTLEMVFAFNMAFADLHRATNELIRFPLDDVPVEIPDNKKSSGDPCFGPRAESLVKKLGHVPEGNVENLLETFRAAILRHTVSVCLPGEKDRQDLHLVVFRVKTDLREDVEISYPSKRASLILPLGNKPIVEFREYGVFIRPSDLAIIHAFNRSFADYDLSRQALEYYPWPELKPAELNERSYHRSRPWSNSGFHGAIMYALPEPKK